MEYNGQEFNVLSRTKDMQCLSFGLLAVKTCPGRKTGENSVCSHCYAQMNSYNIYTIYRSQFLRTEWTRDCMKTAAGRKEWVATMQRAIEDENTTIFRGHDSGDFFNAAYIDCWREVCAALPFVRFWFPTRSYAVPKLLPHLRQLAALPNVAVRPSAMEFDTDVPVVEGLGDGMSVVTSAENNKGAVRLCPKSTTPDGSCATARCRLCWDKTGAVAFLVHGHGGKRGEKRFVSEAMENCRTKFHKEFSLTVLKA